MKTTDRNGREDALMWKTLQLPPCGCTIAGAGTLPDPVRIVFCKVHEGVAAEQTKTKTSNRYPEHEKLAKISSKSQTCGEFLEWLTGPRRYVLGEYHEHTDACWLEGENHTEKRRTCGSSDEELYPAGVNLRKLLAEFFEINEARLEAEKLSMLDAARKSQVAR